MSLKKQATRGAVWVSATRMGINVVDFLVFAFLARILSLEEFGLVGFCLLFIEFANTIVNAGVNQNIVQRKAWDDGYASSTMIYVFGLALCAAMFLLFIAAPIAKYAYSDTAAYVVMSLVPITLLMSLQTVFNGKLAREFKNKQMGIAKFITSLISGVIIIATANLGFGLWSVVIGKLANSLIELCLISYVANFKPKIHFNKADNKELLQFCLPLLGSALLTMAHQRIGVMLTGFVLGPASFALLSAAKKGEQMISQVTLTSINTMVVPSFSRAKDGADIGDLYIKLVAIIATLILPIFMGLAAIADPFITIAFGEKFSDSALFMSISALGMLTGLITWFLPTLLISQAKTKDAFNLNLLAVFSNILVATCTIWFGITTMITAIVLTNFLILPIRFKIVTKHIPINFKKLFVALHPQYVSSLAMFAFILFSKSYLNVIISNEILLLITLVSLGGISYLFFSFVLFYKNTLNQIKEMKAIFFSGKKRGK